MLEVAEIIRRHGAAYRAHVGDRLLPSQARVLRDLAACRTAYFGGQLTQCDHCGQQVYRYHSCRNRHCTTCHGAQTERWLETQRAQLLPCPYYLVTFTLPRALRALAFGHQAAVYGVLMRSAAAALQRLAADPRYVGARLGCLAVLHTWTRAMLYHPHVHLLVTAGGLSADGTQWIAPKHPAFLVPVQALSVIFRAKVGAGLRRARLLAQAPPAVWTTPWSCTRSPLGVVSGCSTTSVAMSSASRSPRADWRPSTTGTSRFAIVTPARRRCGASRSPAWSFCSGFCSTCSRAAARRSATTGCGAQRIEWIARTRGRS